jgi:hypothetical protein
MLILYYCPKEKHFILKHDVKIKNIIYIYIIHHLFLTGYAVAHFWTNYATSRKVEVSVPDGVIGIFH